MFYKLAELLIAFTVLASVQTAQAASVACAPYEGGTIPLNYDYGNVAIKDPANNIPGIVSQEKELTPNGSTAELLCPCGNGVTTGRLYLFGESELPGTGTKSGSYNYYDVPGNEYIQVGTMIYTIGQGYVAVPFSGIGAQTNPDCGKVKISTSGKNTGSGIKVSLRIKKSFVGTSTLPNLTIASTYWTLGDEAGTHGSVASTHIIIAGSITVPQSCTINEGTQVVVDLGSFYSGDFKTAGAKPDSYAPKSFNVPISCNDFSATANLTLRVQGTPASGYSDVLASDNPDLGVAITDRDGAVLRPNDPESVIPFILNGNDANVTLHTYPVSLTGQAPAEGTFTTLAYLRVDFS